MGVFSGPKIVEDGLVLKLDGANYKSFKGSSASNLLYNISNTYGSGVDQTYFKVSYGDIIENIPELGYKSVRYCNIYNDYNSGSGQCCPSPLRYGGNVLGQNITVFPSTTYTYQIIYKVKSGYTNANYMYRYEYNGGTYVTEGGVHTTNNRISLGDNWWFAWGQFTTQSTTNNLWLAGMWYYQYGVYDTIYVAGVSLHQGTNIIPAKFMLTPQENRGTTVATGGGWADLTGNGNHGTLVNGVREDSANGGSLVFDGTDDYIDCGNNSSLSDIGGTTNITVSSWVYYNAYGGGGQSYSVITVKGNPWTWLMENPSNTFRFRITAGGSDVSVADTSTHLLNTWYNVIGTYDGSNMCIYVNGVLKNTRAQSGTLATNSVTAKIGTFQGTNYNLTGRISNVSIYNRALTAAEIQQNFNATRGRFGL